MKTRREFLSGVSKGTLACALSSLLAKASLATPAGQETLAAWFHDLAEAGRQLAEGQLTPGQWQDAMDELYGRTPLSALLKFIDFERVRQEMAQRDLEGRGDVFDTLFVGRPGNPLSQGSEPHRVLISKIAHVRQGRSIPPHGHGNMVSAFLNISGELHVRQYDKLREDRDSLLIRPTVNKKRALPGSWSSISDQRNNVHWLTAASDDCFLFTCKLIRLDESRSLQGRINCDVLRGEDVGGGLLRAPKISAAQARERY